MNKIKIKRRFNHDEITKETFTKTIMLLKSISFDMHVNNTGHKKLIKSIDYVIEELMWYRQFSK